MSTKTVMRIHFLSVFFCILMSIALFIKIYISSVGQN